MPSRSSSSRRQTMATLNPMSTMSSNRRQTIDPSSAVGSTTKSRPPRGGRKSMIPSVGRENFNPATPQSTRPRKQSISTGNHRRRSSIAGDRRQSLVPPSMPTRTDPRPVSDRSYQQECAKRLLDFLAKSSYDHPISPKSLRSPSGKDFLNIVTFMLRLVDPNFHKDSTMKIEDEISMNFRAMGYPFTVSKTTLVAAGSPHSWSTLLAALTWLMERIECMSNCKEENDDPRQFESVEELEAQTDKAFFKYLSAAYTAFLRGDEKLTEELENALGDRFERDDELIAQEIQIMDDKNGIILEELAELEGAEEDLQHHVVRREDLFKSLEGLGDVMTPMNEELEEREQQKAEVTNKLEETNRQLERVATHIEELKVSINNQELSVEDTLKMKNDLKGIEEAFDRTLTLRDQRRKTLWDIDSELKKSWNDLETVISDYNAQHCELNLLPLVSANSINMKATLDKAAVDDGDKTKLIGVDLVTSIIPALSSSKQQYNEKLSESKWKFQEALDKLESSEEGFTEAHEELKIIDAKIGKCEETLQAERNASDGKLAVRVKEAVSMEDRVTALRDPIALEEQMARYERQCAELESLRQKHEEQNIVRKRDVSEEIERACNAIMEYDERCAKQIKDIQKYKEDLVSALGELNAPENMPS